MSFSFAAMRVSLVKTIVHSSSHTVPREISEALFNYGRIVAVRDVVDSFGDRLMIPLCEGYNCFLFGSVTGDPLHA